jgi:hypothetical protein
MKNFTRKIILFFALVGTMSVFTANAAFVPPLAKAEKAKQLTYSKNLSKKEVEQFLGRKMTSMEKLGFKLNKKKFVALTNYTMGTASAADSDRFNGWAIAGFVTSLFIGPLGLIFSIIALGQINRTGQRGRGFAIAGLVIGIISTVWLLLLLF